MYKYYVSVKSKKTYKKEISYIATKKSKNLTCIILNERSQSVKATYYVIPTLWHSGKNV